MRGWLKSTALVSRGFHEGIEVLGHVLWNARLGFHDHV
ncbi:hypothetical protein ABIE33_007246 [Ensifer sp. 4252]